MTTKTETITITYKVFEPGELVMSGATRCTLEPFVPWRVVKYWKPTLPYETHGVIDVERDGEKESVGCEYVIPYRDDLKSWE